MKNKPIKCFTGILNISTDPKKARKKSMIFQFVIFTHHTKISYQSTTYLSLNKSQKANKCKKDDET